MTNCHQLKLAAADGRQRPTDVATAETLLRLVQSVPSPKAEPIKLWLAKVGYERMQEMADPSRSLDRARETWRKHGRSEKWIQQRMTGQETRNKLTDYWVNHEIKPGEEFAILTNIIHQEWSGVSVKAHKQMKGLLDHNLRDHMSEAELIFTALAGRRFVLKPSGDGAEGAADGCPAPVDHRRLQQRGHHRRIVAGITGAKALIDQRNHLIEKLDDIIGHDFVLSCHVNHSFAVEGSQPITLGGC